MVRLVGNKTWSRMPIADCCKVNIEGEIFILGVRVRVDPSAWRAVPWVLHYLVPDTLVIKYISCFPYLTLSFERSEVHTYLSNYQKHRILRIDLHYWPRHQKQIKIFDQIPLLFPFEFRIDFRPVVNYWSAFVLVSKTLLVRASQHTQALKVAEFYSVL